MQQYISPDNNYAELKQYIINNDFRRIFLVCGRSFFKLELEKFLVDFCKNNNLDIKYFYDFEPNPDYSSVVFGLKKAQAFNPDCIIAIGGGSAIDVAKCIKLFYKMNSDSDLLKETIVENDIPLFTVPTTAGTGSESTRYAVIYLNGEKQSVTNDAIIPSALMLDPDVITSLPDYHRKASMLDALSHAIESFWSVNSTDESKTYAKKAIKLILSNKMTYLKNIKLGNGNMLLAANYAGRAINITQTTAGHAMCYKLTKLYDIAHGHACALVNLKLWPYMLDNIDDCSDPRGKQYLIDTFKELAECFNCDDSYEAIRKYEGFYNEMNLSTPQIENGQDYEVLINSVNLTRLKNNPISLNNVALDFLYHKILEC